jgi:hypothetical protein
VAAERKQRTAVEAIPLWSEMYDRLVAHLKANEVGVDTATLGPWLDVDRPGERFRDSEEANRLVRGFYRKPYTVPDLSA